MQDFLNAESTFSEASLLELLGLTFNQSNPSIRPDVSKIEAIRMEIDKILLNQKREIIKLGHREVLQEMVRIFSLTYGDNVDYTTITNELSSTNFIPPPSYRVTIHYPKLTITNSENSSHTIRDLYCILNIRYIEGKGIFYVHSLSGFRGTLSKIEVDRGYIHSHCHMNGDTFCTGSGEVTELLSLMKEKTFNSDIFELFLEVLNSAVRWESLEGTPYHYIKNLANISPVRGGNIQEEIYNGNEHFLDKLSTFRQYKTLCHSFDQGYFQDNTSIGWVIPLIYDKKDFLKIDYSRLDEFENLLLTFYYEEVEHSDEEYRNDIFDIRVIKRDNKFYFLNRHSTRSNRTLPTNTILYKGEVIQAKLPEEDKILEEESINIPVVYSLYRPFVISFLNLFIEYAQYKKYSEN